MTSSTGVDGLEVVLLPAAATPYVADTWLWENKKNQMVGTTLDAWEKHMSPDLQVQWEMLRFKINTPILRLQFYNNITF